MYCYRPTTRHKFIVVLTGEADRHKNFVRMRVAGEQVTDKRRHSVDYLRLTAYERLSL